MGFEFEIRDFGFAVDFVGALSVGEVGKRVVLIVEVGLEPEPLVLRDCMGEVADWEYRFVTDKANGTPRAGDLEFRSLWYPANSYYLILMGSERGDMRYIGAMDKDWNVRHSVSLPRGDNTGSLLRGLPKF